MNNEIQIIWKDLCQELSIFIDSKIKNEEISKDILQETFLKAHMNIHKLRDTSKLTAWIYQITRNNINDYFRKHQQTIQIDHLALPIIKELSYQNLSNCINSKIKQLPKKYEEAIVLTTFQNLKQTELAEYLGISYSGTKSRVQRAKEKLKELVIDCENVESDTKNKIIEHNLDD